MPKFQDRTIDKFKNALKGSGARSNLFEVSFGNADGLPSGTFFDALGGDFSNDDLMLIKAAQLPASTITEIPVPFRGRTLKIAGDRTFDPWTITIINDTDFKWRIFFERWMNAITKISDGSGETRIDNEGYMQDMVVSQLTRGPIGPLNTRGAENTTDIEVLRSYKLYGAFPTNLSTIDLSYNNENEIEEFTVDLQVQWWEAFDKTNSANDNAIV
jgi:hypothetical protein